MGNENSQGQAVAAPISLLGVWELVDLAATAGAAFAVMMGSLAAAANPFIVPGGKGTFVRLTVRTNAAVTGGTLFMRPTIDGSTWGPELAMTAGQNAVFNLINTPAGAPEFFSTANIIGVNFRTAALVPAATLDAVIGLYGTYNRGRLP